MCFGKLFDNTKKAHLSKIKAAVQSIAEQKKLIEIHSTGNNMNEPHRPNVEQGELNTNDTIPLIKVQREVKLS